MKEIILNCGSKIKVDDEDYDFLTHVYDFYINEYGYVMCKLKEKYKRKKMGFYTGISLHKLLMLPEKTGRSINVDHRDGDKLNNQKSNLRVCRHSENMKNRKSNRTYAKKKPKSKYKGVYWNKKMNMWRAQIKSDDLRFSIGCFTDEIAAANAYNYYCKKFHGEFAQLNDVPYMPKEEWEKYKAGNNQSSKYRGVSYSNNEKKWIAQICHNYKREVIGRFDTEIEAAEAYNKRALELKGDKAKLNIINKE